MAKLINYKSKSEIDKEELFSDVMDKLKIKQLFGDHKNSIECIIIKSDDLAHPHHSFELHKKSDKISITKSSSSIGVNPINNGVEFNSGFSHAYSEKDSIDSRYFVEIAKNDNAISVFAKTKFIIMTPMKGKLATNKFIKEEIDIRLSENSTVVGIEEDKLYYILILFCPINNIPMIKIYDGEYYNDDLYDEDEESFVYNVLDIYNSDSIFNSWNKNIDVDRIETEYTVKEESNKGLRSLNFTDRFNDIVSTVENDYVDYNKDGSIREFSKFLTDTCLYSADIDGLSKIVVSDQASLDIRSIVEQSKLPIDEYIDIYKDGKLDIDTIFEKIDSPLNSRDFALPKSYYYENNISKSGNFENTIRKIFSNNLDGMFKMLHEFCALDIYFPDSYSIMKVENENAYVIEAHYNKMNIESKGLDIDTTLTIFNSGIYNRVNIVGKNEANGLYNNYCRFMVADILITNNGVVLINTNYRFEVQTNICFFDYRYRDFNNYSFNKNTSFDRIINKSIKTVYESPELYITANIDNNGSITNIERFYSPLYCRTDNFVYIRDKWGIPRKFNIN